MTATDCAAAAEAQGEPLYALAVIAIAGALIVMTALAGMAGWLDWMRREDEPEPEQDDAALERVHLRLWDTELGEPYDHERDGL